MPTFYFHVHNSIETRDYEGAEFPDLASAREHAIKEARALMADDLVRLGHLELSHSIEIEEEDGVTLLVRFGEAATISP